MTKISELDPLHTGFTPTLDLIPVVHNGKTYSMRVSDFQMAIDGSTYLPTSGGQLTGPLYLYDIPRFDQEAATKGYVDSHVPIGGPFLPISGGQMLGNLSLVGDPVEGLDAASKSYVDTLMAATASGGVTVMEYTIKTVMASGDPGTGAITFNASNQSDATALYVDQVSNAGRDWTLLLMALKVGQKISIQPIADHSRVARWTIAAPAEDMGGYTILHVTPVSATGFPLPNNTTVAVAVLGDTAAEFLPLSGGTMQGGISFGQRFGANLTDLTQHISLFDGWGGFNITGNSLNMIAGSTNVLSSDGGWLYAKVPVTLPRTPTSDWEAVPKNYVDGNFAPVVSGGYVKKTGDQMSGALYITSDTDATIRVIGTGGDWPAVKWNTTTATSAAGYFESQRYGKPRWSIEFGTGGGEPGGNVGTDYIMNRFDDDGNWISPTPLVIRRGTGAIETYTPLYLMGDPTTGLQAVPMRWVTNNFAPIANGGYVMKTGDVMTGELKIRYTTGWPTLTFDALAAGTAAGYIQAARNGVPRWSIELGGGAAESGTATGSPLNIRPFDNQGNPLAQIIRAFRDTMAVTFPGGGPVTIGAATNNSLVITPGAATTTSPVTLATSRSGPILIPKTGEGVPAMIWDYGSGPLPGFATSPVDSGVVVLAGTDTLGMPVRYLIDVFNAYSSTPRFTGRSAEGPRAAPRALTADDVLVDLDGIGYDGTAYHGGGEFRLLTLNDWSAGDRSSLWELTANNGLGGYCVSRVYGSGRAEWGPDVRGGNYGMTLDQTGHLRLYTGGLNLGNDTVALAQDTSRHINLYNGFAGFSVTGGTLNIVSNWDTHFVDMNGVVTLSLNNAGDLELRRDPVYPKHAVNRGWIETNYLTATQADARFVNVTGDTMTGGLEIAWPGSNGTGIPLTWYSNNAGNPPPANFSASLGLSYGGMVDFDFFNNLSDTSESRGFIWWQRMPNGVSAIMQLRNSGSFWIDRYNPADGTYLGQSFAISAWDGRVTVKNWMSVDGGINVGTSAGTGGMVAVNGAKQSQYGTGFQWQAASVARFQLSLDNYPAEDGTDIGSGLTMHRFADDGHYLGSSFSVNRKTGGFYTQAGLFVQNIGIDFGGATVTDAWDLSKHIRFHYAGYGISVTNTGMLSHVTDAPGNNVFIAGTVETARINATGLHMKNLGISLGEFQVAGDYDLSKHILLYDGGGQHTYGFNVQWNGVNPAHFNYVAGLDGVHQFLIQGTGLIGTFQPAGLLMNGGISFGSAITGNNNTDLTKHISLYPNHGINVSYRGMNIVAGASYFINDSITTVALSSTVISMYVGLSFGGDTTPSGRPTDLSRHLDLFGGSYGLSVTNNRLNIVSPVWTYFNSGGNDIARFDATGLTFDGFYTVTLGREPTTDMEAATRKYADGVLDRAGGPFLPLTAGSGMALTGMLYLPHTTPTVDEHATPLFYVRNADQVLQDQISAVAAGNLVFFGQLHLNPAGTRDEVFYKTMLNLPNGPLPDPTLLVKGSYFIVVEAGIPPASGTHIPPMPAGTSQYVRGDWFISDGEDWIFLPLGLVYFTASAVAVDPPVQGTYNVQDTLQWFDANDLKIAGGTMQGHLYLDGIPTTGTQAASKDYVDNKAFLKLTGGTMQGGISFGSQSVPSGNPTDTSRHITLWQPGMGFSITDARLNYTTNVNTSHVFLVGGADVMLINAGGIGMYNGYDIYLSRPPTLDMQAVNKKYVDDQMSGYLKLTGGNMTGDILMTGTTRVNFFNGSMFIGSTGLDRADNLGVNFALGSWHGIGLTTTCPGQMMPFGMYGIAFSTRDGYIEMTGLSVREGRNGARVQVQALGIARYNNDQTIEINSLSRYPSLVSITNPGGSVNVGDRFRDDYGNAYTALAVSGGGVTDLRMDHQRMTINGPGSANPIGLTAIAGSVAFNVQVQLAWTMPTRLVMQHTAGQVVLYAPGGGVYLDGGGNGVSAVNTLWINQGINFGNGVVGNPQDASRGITFYGTPTGQNYSILVTGSTLNFNVFDASNKYDFYAGGNLLLRVWGGDKLYSYLPLNVSSYIQIDGVPGGNAGLILNNNGGETSIWGYNSGRARWLLRLALGSSEGTDTTGTTGSAFEMHAYGNDGHYVGQALFITRAEGRGGDVSFNGHVYLAQDPWQPTSAVNKRWIETNYLTTAQADARFVNADGDTMTGSLTIQQNLDVRGQLAANGDFVFTNRHNGDPIPPSGGGWLLWNSSGGWGEVSFVNGCSWAPAGFDFMQVTGTGTWKTLATLRSDAILRLFGLGVTFNGVAGGGNAIAFTWTADSALKLFVDGNDLGYLASRGWVSGNYLALTGGTVNGATNFNGQTNFSPAIKVSSGGVYLDIWPNHYATGAYNGIVVAGDVSFVVSTGVPNSGVITLMPWSESNLGIRIDGAQHNVAIHAATGIYFYGMTLHNGGIAWSTQGGDFRPGSIYTDPNWGGLFRGHPGVNSDLAFADRAGTSVIYVRYPGLVSIDGATTFGSSVTLNKDPSQPMEAATRRYVDGRTPITTDAPNNELAYGRRLGVWDWVPAVIGYGNVAFDMNTPSNSFMGLRQITNQSGGLNWPYDQYDQCALVLEGWNSNQGWRNQLMMGGRDRGGGPAIWYRSQQDGGWTDAKWYRMLGTVDGYLTVPLTMTQAIQFVSNGNNNYIRQGPDGVGPINNNIKIESWWGVGFYNSVGAGSVPGGQAGIWFDTREGIGSFRQITLSRDPTANMDAVTRQWVVNNYAPIVGGGYVARTGDVMSGPLRINHASNNTSAQLWLSTPNMDGGQSRIRFGGNFVGNADQGARYVASIRSGFAGIGWGSEFLDVWITNQVNDDNTDARQSQIARFTMAGLSVSGYSWASGNIGGNAVVSNSGQFIMANNPAYYFERRNDGFWRFVEGNNPIFQVDPGGSATIYGNATFNGVSTFLNQPTVRGTNPQFNLDGPPASWRTIQWWSSGSPRWNIQAEYSNETGSNVGSDLILTRWTDTGTPGAILRFNRETGRMLMQGGPSSDTIQMTVPAGQSARYWSTVTNARTWSAGTRSDGLYVISDENAPAARFWIGTNGDAVFSNRLQVNGVLAVPNAGLTFGQRTAIGNNPLDLSQHIQLWEPNYGFSVTGGTLNIVAGGATNFYPTAGGLVASFNGNGITLSSTLTVTLGRDPTSAYEAATKQYTDNKFVAISGGNYVAKTGDSMTGALGVTNAITITAAAGNASTLWLVPVAGQPSQIIGNRGGLLHWNMQLGDGQAGDNFLIHRYNDAGTYLDAPFVLNRATGDASFNHAVFAYFVQARTASGGYIALQPAGVNNSGYVALFNNAGARTGYIGNTDTNWLYIQPENGPTGVLLGGNIHVVGTASVTSGVVYRSYAVNQIGFGWDGTNGLINLYVDGVYQHGIAARQWTSANFKNIGAYTPNQNVDNGAGPTFAGTNFIGDNVTKNVYNDGQYGHKYRWWSNSWLAMGWNGRVQCWIDGGAAYVELRDTRDPNGPNQNCDYGAGPTFSIVWCNNNGIVYSAWNGQAVALPWDGYSVAFRLDGGYQGRLLRSYDTGGGWTGCHQLMLNGNGTCGIWWPGDGFAGWSIVWSDRRLKSNIRPATIDALGQINRLTFHELDLLPPVPNAVSQHWDCALIADEVEEVIPLAVVKNNEGEGYAQIRELPLIATMARAIQQLTEQNVALMARMEQLEQRMH